jgi:hypothetical protein
MTRDEIVTEARKWLMVPHLHRGRTRHGLDCLGLGIKVAEHFGVPHEDMPDYSEQPHPRRLVLTVMRRWLKPMPRDGNLTGCLGVFAMVQLPCHIGFFTWKEGQVHVLHTRLDIGVAEEAFQRDVLHAPLRIIDVLAFPDMTED